ncbi:MAG: beta-galactosidase [Christensenellales bacterium]
MARDNVFQRVLYGGDYNPEQWPREIWQEDLRLFRLAGINSATVNVFSWAKLQPCEESYDFRELDDIVEMLGREGIAIVMATSTAALPAWMFRRYPEVARTDYEGRRHRFGNRHNACPNSPVYRDFARRLAEQLARRYGDNPNIVCWHVNNEYGGECFCEHCEKAFRVWLRQRYGSLTALNRAWNTAFWGHTLYDWDDIVPPTALSDGIGRERTAFAGLSLDYRRFMSHSLLENFKMERDQIRRYAPGTPITTNLMGTYKNLDYFAWAREMDIVSWDSYPSFDTPPSMVALRHDLMRGLKQRPFMLMEQTPSQQNWQPYNALKKPGQMRAQSYQAIAHGADTIQFFQLRQLLGACEKFHSAVISHQGTENTRVFQEVAGLGRELAALGGSLLGADRPAQVGLLFDWDTYWALEYASGPRDDLSYVQEIHACYRCLYERNIPVDLVAVDADFSPYALILAPALYMVKPGVGEALEAFVASGAVLVTTYLSGLVGPSDNVHLGGYPGPLRRLAGIWVEETDALAPGKRNELQFSDGSTTSCDYLCDIIHLEGAAALASYASSFYSGTPAITRHAFRGGIAYYLGTRLPHEALCRVLDQAITDAGVTPLIPEATALEVSCRVLDGKRYWFLINLTEEPQPLPATFAGKLDKLSGEPLPPGRLLPPCQVLLVEG